MQISQEHRQEKIKELIENFTLSDQKEIVELLHSKFQIRSNQAVISRDLRKLGVIKKQVGKQLVYQLPSFDVQTEILKLGIVGMSHNESMIVIKTRPGLAAVLGDFIDDHLDDEILGCIAGENTVFVSPKSVLNIEELFITISKKLHFKP
jgi:transcriptional regulator of arginine metabolism